jgi:glycosyltransferase involved in cell wall biosynthesis
MKLSIITINYNNAEGLRKTLASVAAQTYAEIEHIIVDGGSTDGSVEVIRDYSQSPIANRHEIVWVSEKDKGIYNAMNKGIEIALGRMGVTDDHHSMPITSNLSPLTLSDYIQILNSGDIIAVDDVTERMMAALAQQVRGYRLEVKGNENSKAEKTASSPLASSLSPIENGPAIFYGNMIKEYPDGRRVKDTCGGGDYTPESFLYFYKGTLNHDCAYIRRDLFEKYGLYNEQMKICSDWEWYVRAIVLGGERTVYTNIDVTVFDMTGISESDGKNRTLIQQERRAYLESILPASVLRDYDMYTFPLLQYQRLKKYHLWGIVHFMERVLFKLEKWFKK